jgi:NAD(P)-dependent dehydrogenase (short-subunit alcohol dehydrogenase family)
VVSKGGMEALTLAMAVDLAPHGIRVNGIRVGPVITDRYYELMPERLKREVASAPRDEAIAVLDRQAATLVGRMGRPSDIAPVALFLASEESGFLTGSIVNADGGRMISRKVEPLL